MNKTVFHFLLNSVVIFFLAINTGYALNKKISAVKNKLKKVDLIYYDRFPYKKSYDGIKIPECIRIPVRKRQKASDILLCREYITLLRPASVIKLWQHQMRLKGYIPFSMKEFGIINVRAHIIGVNKYISVIKNNITSDSIHVTGKFIRYTPKVNHYKIRDRKTNVISAIDATPNHSFYVVNKHKFIPISKILPSDFLITFSNHLAHLMHPSDNHYLYTVNNKKNTLTRVYNIEIEKKHVYFISRLRILVHNPCLTLERYYSHLKEHDIIQKYFINDDSYVEMCVKKSDIDLLYYPKNRSRSNALNLRGGLKSEILEKIHRLGFCMQRDNRSLSLEEASRINIMGLNRDEIIYFRLSEPLPLEDYEENFIPNIRDYYALLQDKMVSSTETKLGELTQRLSTDLHISPGNTDASFPNSHPHTATRVVGGAQFASIVNSIAYVEDPYHQP